MWHTTGVFFSLCYRYKRFSSFCHVGFHFLYKRRHDWHAHCERAGRGWRLMFILCSPKTIHTLLSNTLHVKQCWLPSVSRRSGLHMRSVLSAEQLSSRISLLQLARVPAATPPSFLPRHIQHTMQTTLRISHSVQNNGQQCLRSLQQQQCRHVSSFRRTKKMLLVQPDPSFKSSTGNQDHIIYNPPSSAPNVYHTPLKFLPKDDPRRRLHTLLRPTASDSTSSLPPAVRPVYEKKYHLKEADIAEIRRLRAEDPRQWTRVRLAEKFECSQFFVSLCCSAPQIKDERKVELEKIKEKWGRTKTEAREDRQTRKQSWGKAV